MAQTRDLLVPEALHEPWPKSGAKDARTPDAVAQIRGAIACAERLERGAFTTAFGVGLSTSSQFMVSARVQSLEVFALQEPNIQLSTPNLKVEL